MEDENILMKRCSTVGMATSASARDMQDAKKLLTEYTYDGPEDLSVDIPKYYHITF